MASLWCSPAGSDALFDQRGVTYGALAPLTTTRRSLARLRRPCSCADKPSTLGNVPRRLPRGLISDVKDLVDALVQIADSHDTVFDVEPLSCSAPTSAPRDDPITLTDPGSDAIISVAKAVVASNDADTFSPAANYIENTTAEIVPLGVLFSGTDSHGSDAEADTAVRSCSHSSVAGFPPAVAPSFVNFDIYDKLVDKCIRTDISNAASGATHSTTP
mmetsp:Transcript_108154/g.345417  ORF Transcript_108154/g.345417 Transcript_108154/m.345417 type:complete len:217 (-) Transcript_108154:557-1207(-)